MPSRSLRSSKKQTRLQFSPLPSSSPAREKYSNATQDRLAIIRHEFAGRSPNLQAQMSDDSPHMALPTPENSSQPVLGEDESPISSPLSEPPSSIISPLDSADQKNLRPLHSVPPHDGDAQSNVKGAGENRKSDDDDSSQIPSSAPNAEEEKDEEEEEEEEEQEEDDDIPVPSAKRRKLLSHMRDRSDSGVNPRRSSRLRPSQLSSPWLTTSSRKFAAAEMHSPNTEVSPLGSPETTGDEDDVMASKPTLRRRRQKTTQDDFIVEDDKMVYSSSEEEIATPSRTRPRFQKAAEDNFIVDDGRVEYIPSEDEGLTPSKKQKLTQNRKSHRTPRGKSHRERLELEEDLEDLQDSDTLATETRTRGRPVNKAREETRKHLDVLRRRRAGEKISLISDGEDETQPVTFGNSAHNAPTYSVPSDEDSVGSSSNSDIPPTDTNLDEYEDDFIVDDSSELLGMPHPDIPLEFTSYASSRPRELFFHVIDWLVKNKISPAFDRHDPLWTLAFNKLDDEVKAQAGSRLISSAWNVPFVRTLEARPGLKVERLPGDEDDYIRTCDACNRTNHPAQFDFKFSGQAYFHKTLEPVRDDDDDDDTASVDSKRHVLPSASQHFYLGRYCAANAEMGHKLSHWLFHLNENLLSYLEDQGVLSPDQIVARDRKTHKKREREAEEIVDTMREAGVIEELWKDFKNDLDDARIGMDGFQKRGQRSKGRVGSIRVQREDDDGDIG